MELKLKQLLTKLSGLTMARLAGAALVFAGNIAIVRLHGPECPLYLRKRTRQTALPLPRKSASLIIRSMCG